MVNNQESEGPFRPKDIDFAQLVEDAPDSIVVLDSLGFVQYINSTAEIVSGYRREELVGRHFAEIGVVAASSIPKAVKEFAQTMTGKPGPPYTIEIRRKDGKILAAEVNHRPLYRDGKIAGVNVIFRLTGGNRAFALNQGIK